MSLIALSGARGTKNVKQLATCRGALAPGSTPCDFSVIDMFYHYSLCEGTNPEKFFHSSFNSRSSMCDKKLGTGAAGGITRWLVGLMWDMTIVEDDCGSNSGDLSQCQSINGVCSRCYGPISDGDLHPVGFPVGLIGAQSIGERGTQLSMQSFHTGQNAFTPGSAKETLLKAKTLSVDAFLEKIRKLHEDDKTDAYCLLDPRHFILLWRTLQNEHTTPLRTLAFSGENKFEKSLIRLVMENAEDTLAHPVTEMIYPGKLAVPEGGRDS